jgi:hypothetical protein
VIGLVQSSPLTSSADNDEKLLNALSKLNLDDDGKCEKRELVSESSPLRKEKERYEPTTVAHITKLCASFSRATTLLTDLGQCDGAQDSTVQESFVV